MVSPWTAERITWFESVTMIERVRRPWVASTSRPLSLASSLRRRAGEEALHKAKESHYDIVFLDVNMPGMNGLETFVKLGQAAPNSAVVMITGYGKTLKAVIEEARTLGVRAVIDKPFKINQITEAIREIIPHAD